VTVKLTFKFIVLQSCQRPLLAQSVSKQVEEAVPLSRISTNQIFIGGIAA
jgi:hypothetical protein